jgi:hypothetical protein
MTPKAPSLCSPTCPVCRIAQSVPSGAEVAFGDWDLLMDAVKDRLDHVVGLAASARILVRLPDASDRALSAVLECITALGQLHMSLAHEFRLRETLAQEAFLQANRSIASAPVQVGA